MLKGEIKNVSTALHCYLGAMNRVSMRVPKAFCYRCRRDRLAIYNTSNRQCKKQFRASWWAPIDFSCCFAVAVKDSLIPDNPHPHSLF